MNVAQEKVEFNPADPHAIKPIECSATALLRPQKGGYGATDAG